MRGARRLLSILRPEPARNLSSEGAKERKRAANPRCARGFALRSHALDSPPLPALLPRFPAFLRSFASSLLRYCLSAVTGSTRIARNAGNRQAMSAAVSISAATVASVSGSAGCTP